MLISIAAATRTVTPLTPARRSSCASPSPAHNPGEQRNRRRGQIAVTPSGTTGGEEGRYTCCPSALIGAWPVIVAQSWNCEHRPLRDQLRVTEEQF